MDMKEKIVRMEERLNLEESLITGEIAFKVESELVQRIMADYHPARIPYLTINKLEQMIFLSLLYRTVLITSYQRACGELICV